MTDVHTTLNRVFYGKPVHKRTFTKPDRRLLHLYGYEKHELAAAREEVDDIPRGGELRWHPFRKEWNIYAAHRQNRTFKPVAAKDPLAPSLPGREVTEIPFSDFEIAVFENKFTSLHPTAPPPTPINQIRSSPGTGHCEVVVYTPESSGNLYSIGQDQRRLLIATWIDRYAELFRKGCNFVYPFENRGDEVGVTLAHPHGQIYGFSFVPDVQQKMAEAFEQGYDLATDIRQFWPEYGISEAGGLVAFCPPYYRFPYETWIVSKARHPGPWAFSDEEVDGFAYLLGDICHRYDRFFGRETPYMLALNASPVGYENSFHFTAQFYPLLRAPDRQKYLASVEQGTGVFTIDVMPEAAARTLKGTL